MRLATGDQFDGGGAQTTSGSSTHFALNQINHEPLPQTNPLQSQQDLQIVARATNDAVRDWDVKTGRLSWPQGLESLLGYCSSRPSEAEANRSSVPEEIAFWQQQVHPEDLPATMSSIADALAGPAEHWSGEYRFRRCDGTYLLLLERAFIVRDEHGRAERFIGSLMHMSATS